MKKLRSHFFAALCLSSLAAFLATGVRAASVGPGGYTNSFGNQPSAADWATFPIAGAAADMTTSAALDSAMQGVAAGSITTQLGADATDPPAFSGTAAWCSSGFYVQTRPTGVGATLLMCALVNNLGVNASGVTLSYDLAKLIPAAEEIDGHRSFYSLTGAAGSWVLIPEFSTATAGRLTATLNIAWSAGSALYILWGDDNGSASPDTAFQIDNFSATGISAVQVPVSITSSPQNQTVGELMPANFTVSASGNPAPTYQWYKNVGAIADATNATYSIAAAPLSDGGAQFKVVAANTANSVNYSVTSGVAVLTVNADTVAPTLVRALGVPPTTVSAGLVGAMRSASAR